MERTLVGTMVSTILIIGNVSEDNCALSDLLRAQGYTIYTIWDKPVTITAITQYAPDIILPTIKMAETDGYTFCQQVKADRRTRALPVILIGGPDVVVDRAHVFAVGGADYLPWPFQPEEVLARVETQLTRYRLEREIERRLHAHTDTLRQTNQALQAEITEREVEYQSLFAHMPTSVAYHQVLCDAAHRPLDLLYVDVNDAFETLTGLKRTEVIGRRFTELFLNSEPARFDLLQIYEHVKLTGTSMRIEGYFPPLKKWLSVAMYSPRPGYCVTISEDISERKRTEEALRQSEARFRGLFEQAPIGIGLSRYGTVIAVNPAFLQMYGYDQTDNLAGTAIEAYCIPAERPTIIERARRWLTGELTEVQFDLTGLRKDGTFFPVVCQIARIELDGAPTLLGFFTDVTAQKTAEAALCASETRYRTIIQNFPKGSVYMFDHSLRYILTQGTGLSHVGLTPAMLEGKTIWEALDPDTCAVLEPHYRAALLGTNSSFETAYRNQIYEVHTLPTYADDGTVAAGIAVAREITAYRAMEETLRTNQERMQAILDNAAVGIVLVDPGGRFREVNDRWVAMTGYSVAELLEMTPWDMTYPDDSAAGHDQFARLARGEIRQFRQEKRYIRKDGSIFWADVAVSTLRNAQGELDTIMAVVVDISDQKQAEAAIRQLNADLERRVIARTTELSQANAALHAEIAERQRTEEALRESQRFIENIANTIPDLLYVYDIIARQNVYVNRDIALILGYTPEQIRAMGTALIPNLLHPDDLEHGTTWQLQRIAAAADGEILELEYRMKHADGTWRWLAVRETVFTRTPDGQPEQVLGVSQDITERKQAEEAYYTLVEHAPLGLIIVQEGRIVFANPAMATINGYSIAEMLAWSSDDLNNVIYADDRSFVMDHVHNCLMGKDVPEHYEYRIVRKDGGVRWVAAHGIVREYRGRPASQGTYLDITERKQAEDKLRQYADELQQSMAETRQFAYIVSHDLRAPLVNLKGFAAELQMAMNSVRPALDQALTCLDPARRQEVRTAINEDVPEALEFITAAVDRMDHLINALLKLSRLGRREINPERIDMQELVAKTLQTLAHQIEVRQIQVQVAPLPTVVADPIAMEQIMGNILSNAVLYLDPTRPGQIEIDGNQGETSTLIRVRDNGRGIASEDMDKVFAPFRRAGKLEVAGEGMGLAYVQALVRRHGGQIWCESEPGVGTLFTFSLPNLVHEEY